MFVTNHVLSGVVIGRLLRRHPVTAFVAGVASHLVLDMVPHWGCDLKTADDWEGFVRYAKRDGVLGLAVALGATGAVDRRSRPRHTRGHGWSSAARRRQTHAVLLGP